MTTTRPPLQPAPAGSRPALDWPLDGFGYEPPLAVAGETRFDRRDVNIRWLSASILTGLTGAALIGAAIYVSLQGESYFAESPERVVAARSPVSDDRGDAAAHKADKLVRSQLVAGTKQVFKAPVTVRAGDREAIRVRSLVRVASGLALTTGAYATDIPSFDPLRLFAPDAPERAAEPVPEAPDPEVSVVKRDLTESTIPATAPALGDADVVAQIEEERRMAAEAGRRASLPAVGPQLMLTRILGQPTGVPDVFGLHQPKESPFDTIDVRVVPENVTTLAKLEGRGSDPLIEERDVVLKRGETLETVLRALGASDERIRGIAGALGERARTGGLPEGQQMRVLLSPGARPGEGRQPARVILFGESGIEAIAAANDRGGFVSVAPPTEEASPQSAARQDGDEDEEGGVRLYQSLYETVLKHDLPRQTAEDLVRIFGYDVDFQRRVASGDGLEIFGVYDEEGGGSDKLDILYASLNIGGEVRRVYRYQSPEDGTIDYFDDQGRSLKKFLLRKPIAEGVMRSGFGFRRHPILGYSKMHTGVDWANRIGTPIMAAGAGTVLKSEWDSGYGRRLEIQHANGYVTAYNHMSRFGRGISPGARVRQGQVVGYVGSTGLSTGPHLHYEVIVNGHFVDPMKIRVPRGKELDGRALAEFKRQREQTDALIQKASSATHVAQRERS